MEPIASQVDAHPPSQPVGTPERPLLVGTRSAPERRGLLLWREFTSWVLPSILVPYVVTRAAFLVAAEVASLTIARSTENGPVPPPFGVSWTAPLLKWDARWYLDIASNWYQYQAVTGPPVQQSVVFFPEYPLLVKGFNAIFGGGAVDSLPTSALLVANLSALVALALLYRLAYREFGVPVAQRTVWYVLAFPVSFYLSAAYAEPVFLLSCVAAIYCARSERWLLAGVAGASAALSRPYGVLIVFPLLFEYVRQIRLTHHRKPRINALSLVLPVLALGGWMAYLYGLTGDALIFVNTQVAWNQELMSPLNTLLIAYGRTREQQLQGRVDLASLQFAIAAVGAGATILTLRLLPATYALFAIVFCAIILSSGSTVSTWRHVFLIFPLYMAAARAGAFSWFDRVYVSLSLVCSGLFAAILATDWSGLS